MLAEIWLPVPDVKFKSRILCIIQARRKSPADQEQCQAIPQQGQDNRKKKGTHESGNQQSPLGGNRVPELCSQHVAESDLSERDSRWQPHELNAEQVAKV